MKCNKDCFNCTLPDCYSTPRLDTRRYCDRPEEQKQHQRDRAKRRRDEARANGLCIICCKEKATHGSKCYECYLRQKRLDMKKNTGRREHWRETGRCYFCGEPVVEGKRTCAKHYSIYSRNMEHCNQSPNTKRAQREWGERYWRLRNAGL